jgi:hypothetical protein
MNPFNSKARSPKRKNFSHPPAEKTIGQLNNSWPTLTCGHPIFHCGPLWVRGVVTLSAGEFERGRNRARARSARRRRRAGARRVGSRCSPYLQARCPRSPSQASEHWIPPSQVKWEILHPCTCTVLLSVPSSFMFSAFYFFHDAPP